MAPPLLAALWDSDSGNFHKGDYLSSSTLANTNGCVRQLVYERMEPFYELASRRYWAFRGTHAHTIVERSWPRISKGGWLQEFTMKYDLDYPEHAAPVFEDVLYEQADGTLEPGKRFTGDFDSSRNLKITIRGTGDAYTWVRKIYADTKTMADAKALMTIQGTKGGTFSKNLDDSHVWQFNIYRLLIANTPVTPALRKLARQGGCPLPKDMKFLPAPETLWMQGIGMMHAPRSGQTYALKERGQVKLFKIDDVPVLPLDEIVEFIRPRALKYYKALVLGYPAPVAPSSLKWLCGSCAFNGEVIPGERCHPNAERKALAENGEG